MKNYTNKIESLIQQKLNNEDFNLYLELEEKGVYGQVLDLFKGKLRWLLILMMMISIAFLGILIYSVNNFLEATEIVSLIKWAAASFICIIFLIMIKIFSWLQMNKNTLIKQIKRLELLIIAGASK